MPLARCPECSHDVSTEALACPHCGYPRPSSGWGVAVIRAGQADVRQAPTQTQAPVVAPAAPVRGTQESYLYPADTASTDGSVRFTIGDRAVRIDRNSDGHIRVVEGDSEVAYIPKARTKQETNTQLSSGHRVSVSFRERSTWDWLTPRGFKVFVDGRPLAGTVADPERAIAEARSALWMYVALGALGTLVVILLGGSSRMPESSAVSDAITGFIVACFVLVPLAIFFQKAPLLATLVGSLFGLADLAVIFTDAVQTGHSGGVKVGIALVKACITVALIRGFLASLQRRALRRQFALAPGGTVS